MVTCLGQRPQTSRWPGSGASEGVTYSGVFQHTSIGRRSRETLRCTGAYTEVTRGTVSARHSAAPGDEAEDLPLPAREDAERGDFYVGWIWYYHGATMAVWQLRSGRSASARRSGRRSLGSQARRVVRF